jgi:hypothetical protein
MDMQRVTMILGDEYDEVLRDALRTVLIENGAIGIDKSWGVGGSQEIESIQVRIGEKLITIESETFVGLTITGAKSVIEKIADQVNKKIK